MCLCSVHQQGTKVGGMPRVWHRRFGARPVHMNALVGCNALHPFPWPRQLVTGLSLGNRTFRAVGVKLLGPCREPSCLPLTVAGFWPVCRS